VLVDKDSPSGFDEGAGLPMSTATIKFLSDLRIKYCRVIEGKVPNLMNSYLLTKTISLFRSTFKSQFETGVSFLQFSVFQKNACFLMAQLYLIGFASIFFCGKETNKRNRKEN